MELRNINTFLHIAELHSFSRTARQLGYSQSAVSSQIAQLEAELGAPLFDRVGKTVRLTGAGETFLGYARTLLATVEQAQAARDTVSLEELVQQEFLLTERGMSYRDALDQCLAAHGLQLQPYLELGSAALLCQMVERGMGLSFLPEYIVRAALAAGTLARLNVPDCRVEMHRQLFYHRDKWLTPQMKGFIALVREGTAQPAAPTQA